MYEQLGIISGHESMRGMDKDNSLVHDIAASEFNYGAQGIDFYLMIILELMRHRSRLAGRTKRIERQAVR